MITDLQVLAFQKRLKRGEPSGEIREEMLLAGFTETDIALVFKPKPYDMRTWLLISIVVVGILGLIVFAQTGGVLILILAVLLVGAYLAETRRLKRLDQWSGKA